MFLSSLKSTSPISVHQRLLGDMWQRLSHSKKKLMEVFHIILNQICLLPILESR
jgi:hypothetical protein